MRNPVIIVHGFNNNETKMKHIAKSLSDLGCTVFSVSLKPSSGKLGIDDLAQQLKNFISDKIDSDQNIDLIGFSMGGLVCRYYLQRLNGLNKVDHFITISTPHNGTWIAFLLCNKGAKQMRFASDFIIDLNKDLDKLKSLKFTSIWTPFDLMILPTSSSHIDFGKEIKIKCLLHPLMVSNKKCIKAIECELLK